MAQATLINSAGQKKVVDVGSSEARQLFGQGYSLMGGQGGQAAVTPSYSDIINRAFNSEADANKAYAAALAQVQDYTNQLPNYQINQQKQLLAQDPELQALQKQRAAAIAQLYAAPSQGQDQYRDILDPIKRQALVQQSVGNVLGGLSGFNAGIEQRFGRASDLAQQAQNILNSRLEGAKTTLGQIGDYLSSISKSKQQKFENQIALEKLGIEKYNATHKGDGIKDRLLTLTEAKTFGVPFGTRMSQVVGREIPQDSTTNNYDDFVKNYQTINPIDMEPGVLQGKYNQYLQAQQYINTQSDKTKALSSVPADLRPLLKVSGATDAFQSLIEDAINKSFESQK